MGPLDLDWWESLPQEPILLLHAAFTASLAIILVVWLAVTWVRRCRGARRGVNEPFAEPLLLASESEGINDGGGEGEEQQKKMLWKLRRRRFIWPRQVLLLVLVVVLTTAGVYTLLRCGGDSDDDDKDIIMALLEAAYWLMVFGLEEVCVVANWHCLPLVIASYGAGAALVVIRGCRGSITTDMWVAIASTALASALLLAEVCSSIAQCGGRKERPPSEPILDLESAGTTKQQSAPTKGASALFRVLHDPPTPEQKAPLFSTTLFWWLDSIIKLGKRKVLDLSDLYHLEDDDLCETIWPRFAPQVALLQRRYCGRRGGGRSGGMVGSGALLAWALITTWPWLFALQGIFLFIATVLQFGVPLSLKYLVNFITHYRNGDDVPTTALLAAAVLFVGPCLAALCNGQQFQIARRLIFRYRAALINLIYRQTLRLDTLVSSTGQVTNLCSVDANSVDAARYIHNMWSTALQIIIATSLLFWVLGRWESGLVGVVFLAVSIPFTKSVSARLQLAQKALMRKKDARLSLLSEVLQGIRVIKLLAWERDFLAKIESSRRSELGSLRTYTIYHAIVSLIWAATPIFVSLATFLLHTLVLHASLTASQGFTALALFGLLRDPLSTLPTILNNVVKAQVSFGRIELFLLQADLLEAYEGRLITHYDDDDQVVVNDYQPPLTGGYDGSNRRRTPTNAPFPLGAITITSGTFYWGVRSGPDQPLPTKAVTDVDLFILPGSFVCVYGPTGAGKSALLLAMLGELRRKEGAEVLMRGKVAYASQKAWIQNGSVRDNILFGEEMVRERYDAVIEACALRPDLEMLAAGDMTEIGEKGVNLSGGQQQRLSLARAVYSDADIYLLDDVLSAVDAHVASHLLERCLTGPLMAGKTRILVTHAPALTLPLADHAVLVGPGGSIVAHGAPRPIPGYFPPSELQAFVERHQRDAKDSDDDDGGDGGQKVGVPPARGEKGQGLSSSAFSPETPLAHPEPSTTTATASSSSSSSPLPASSSATTTVINQQPGSGQLIAAEKRAQGRVKAQVYWAYIAACGGPLLVLPAFLSFFGVEALTYMQNRALGEWVSDISKSGAADWKASLGYIEFSVGSLAVILFRVALTSICSLSASRLIHHNMIHRVLRAPLNWFETTPQGRIQNRFSSDMETIDQDMMDSLSLFLETLVNILAITLVIIINMYPLAVGMIPILAASLWVGWSYQCTSREIKRLESTTRSPIYSHFSETVVGVPTVRAYGRQRQFIRESCVRINRNNRVYHHLWSANRWLAVRLQLLGAAITGMVGVYVISTLGRVSGPVAGLVLLYSMSFAEAMNQLIRSQAEMEMDLNSVERAAVEYCNDIEQEAAPIVNAVRPPSASWPADGELVVHHLTMRYPSSERDVITDLTFRVPPRTRVGIVGRTGAGKSTLTSAFFRLVEPSEGTAITIDGEDILGMGLEDLRSRLAIVPQEATLFKGTIRSNLDPFDEYEDSQIWAALEKAQLANTVVTSLDQHVAESGSNLSVGQRALVCMARALLRMKSVLFLDEATANVDPDTDHIIQEMVREHLRDCTVVSVAHRLQTVAFYDLVLVMDKGMMVEFDSPINLLKKEPPGLFRSMAEKTGDLDLLMQMASEASQ